MADIKIADMTVLTGLAGGDKLPVADASDLTVAKAFTLDELVTFLQQTSGLPRIKALASDHAISSTTATEVTGLGPMTLEAGTYVFQFNLICQSATATVGLGIGVNFTGTASIQTMTLRFVSTGTSAVTGVADDVANTLSGQIVAGYAATAFSTTAPNMLHTGVAAADTNHQTIVEGTLIVTAAGDLELWHSSETATSTTVKAGSSLVVIRTA